MTIMMREVEGRGVYYIEMGKKSGYGRMTKDHCIG